MGGPKRAILALFWAPGGPGPIRKRQFGRHAKTAAENGSNPVRLLKCHVRREKGPTRGPGGPSVTGRGAHVSTAGKRSGAKTKKIKSRLNLQRLSRYLRKLLCFDDDRPRGRFGAQNSQNVTILIFGPLFGPL